MGSLITPLPIVQYKALTDKQKLQLLDELFEALEYNEDGKPGNGRSGADTELVVCETFDQYGVRFTDENQMPNGYRFNRHTKPWGDQCEYSQVATVEPMARRVTGDVMCPTGCPGSVVEADPDATMAHHGRLNVDAVKTHLAALGVAFDTVEHGGTWTVYVGPGEWDEVAERYTHPISFGPCEVVDGRLTADQHDASYGFRTDTADVHYFDGDDDPQTIARDLARLLSETPQATVVVQPTDAARRYAAELAARSAAVTPPPQD